MTRLDRLLAQANPVPDPRPGHVTPEQERLLASIVAVPPRRRRRAAIRLLVPISAAAAVALVFVLLLGRATGVDDETEATAPPVTSAGAGQAELIHVETRLYGSVYGPGLGERLDGWLQPSTGRARIVITTGDEMTLQHVVGADDRVRSWQGALGNANGIGDDRIAHGLARNLRASVRDRMASLVEFAKVGFRQDGTTFGAPTTEPGEYRGRAVTVHRIAPVLKDGGAPSGYYFKWYVDPDNGEIVAFERGPIRDGRDTVDEGEQLVRFETFEADAPLQELDWRHPPPTPTPTGPGAAPTPTPRRN